MPERMDAARLDLVLTRMASAVGYPATPDIAAGVAARLERAPAPSASVTTPWWGMRPAYAVAAVIVALGLFFSVTPGARRAVAEWLGVAGVRIEVDNESTPSVPATSSELDLGEPVTLSEAASIAPFDLKLPVGGPFADPDMVLVDRSGGGVRVSFVYEPGGGIPPSEMTGAGAILSQFDAEVLIDSIKKVSSDGSVRFAEVNGKPAYFISGAPHVVGYTDAEGNLVPDTSRLAGNVLLWELGDITFRLESELTFEQALNVARSIR